MVHRRRGRRDARLRAHKNQDARHLGRPSIAQGWPLPAHPARMGRRVRCPARRRGREERRVSEKRTRANGEGSIFPYRNGYAAYAWVTTPAGRRVRKYVYGKTREEVHAK